jgi:hypothetical protein
MEKSKMLALVLGMAMLFSGMVVETVNAFGQHTRRGGCF